MTERALGRLPARRDPRTLRLATYLDGARNYQAPPPARDWIDHAHRFDLLGNDRVGNCAFAAQAHLIQCFAAAHGRTTLIGQHDVMTAYSRVTGYDPSQPATDRGTVLLDALGDWRTNGLAGHRIGAYVKVDANRNEVEAAINLCGGIYIGAGLPIAARSQTVWDVASSNEYGPEHRPNSWGGHALACAAYSRTGLVCMTWGALKVITWEWLFTYADEIYAVVSDDWITNEGHAPNGFDIAKLVGDLHAATSQAR